MVECRENGITTEGNVPQNLQLSSMRTYQLVYSCACSCRHLRGLSTGDEFHTTDWLHL